MVISSKKLLSFTGEFGLIKFIKNNNTKADRLHNVKLDIGDDCFVFEARLKSKYAVTADILIEDVHFKRKWSTPGQIARKAVEANVSDIASMGCTKPLYMFISAGIPADTETAYAKKLLTAIKNICLEYGIHIAGGDTVKSDKLTISITLIGVVYGNFTARKGAKKGDLICVTGSFGDSGAGFDILLSGRKKLKEYEKKLVKKHLEPRSRMDAANFMAQKKIVPTAMTDSSDGFLKSIELLTSDHGKGASVYLDKIPISKELKKFTGKDKGKLYRYALNGAEEFELVFTASPSEITKIRKLMPDVSVVGHVDGSSKVKYFENNKEKTVKYDGYKHF